MNYDAITAYSESRNRDYRNGRPVRSPAGAMYAMQVMPSTARDPGFGIRPAASNSPDEYNRVGREYRAAMEKRYGGDPAKMWAAYNWGPGNLDNALKRHGDSWLDHAPAETRNYVRNNLSMLPNNPIMAALGRMTPVQGGVDPLAPQMTPQGPQMAQQMAPQMPGMPQQPNFAAMSPYSPINDPLAPKPKAFGKGGAGWSILGAIGDAMMAYGGLQPTFGPQMADLAQQDRQEKMMRERMNMEAQAALAKASEPPKWLQDAQMFQQLPDEQKQAVLGYRDAMYPVIADIAQPDGSVYRQQINRSLPQRAPKQGAVEDGYVFLGGDPSDPQNWSKQ